MSEFPRSPRNFLAHLADENPPSIHPKASSKDTSFLIQKVSLKSLALKGLRLDFKGYRTDDVAETITICPLKKYILGNFVATIVEAFRKGSILIQLPSIIIGGTNDKR